MQYREVQLLAKGDTNAKTALNEVETHIMYLAPSDVSGVINVCPFASEGCRQVCLNTSGRGVYDSTQAARINKTMYFATDRKKFIYQMTHELLAIWGRAKEKGEKRAIRLNGTSDIDFLDLIKRYTGIDFLGYMYKDLIFYDYTKNPNMIKKYLGTRYKLTFSRSETNDHLVDEVLASGGNVAIVFEKMPKRYKGYKVIDGTLSDLRYYDKKNVVVGLKPKGKARKDDSGFVVMESVIADCNSVTL